jgi:hypothetical protein
MQQVARLFAIRLFLGAVLVAAGVLLEHFLGFTLPHAMILLAVLWTWWGINKKVDAIKEQTDWLHTATLGLVLPRLTRVERRQRGWKVPEPPKEDDGEDGEYDDWAMFCASEESPFLPQE